MGISNGLRGILCPLRSFFVPTANSQGCFDINIYDLGTENLGMIAKEHTIATLTACAAEAIQRIRAMSSMGYRVVTPRDPEGIVALLSNVPCVALVVNSKVEIERRDAILREVRNNFPKLLIVHVYTSEGTSFDPLSDVNIDATDPAKLAFALEVLLQHELEVEREYPRETLIKFSAFHSVIV